MEKEYLLREKPLKALCDKVPYVGDSETYTATFTPAQHQNTISR